MCLQQSNLTVPKPPDGFHPPQQATNWTAIEARTSGNETQDLKLPRRALLTSERIVIGYALSCQNAARQSNKYKDKEQQETEQYEHLIKVLISGNLNTTRPPARGFKESPEQGPTSQTSRRRYIPRYSQALLMALPRAPIKTRSGITGMSRCQPCRWNTSGRKDKRWFRD